jgi:hypothetical protein
MPPRAQRAEAAEIQIVIDTLTAEESHRLAHLEGVIDRFRQSYYDTGDALKEIRDARLYRMTHISFESYVGDRWGISRPRAYELIAASQVANNLVSTVADIRTKPETQLRTLTSLEPEDQIRVYTEAAASAPDGRLTASILAEKKNELLASRPAPDPEPKCTTPKTPPSKATMAKAIDRIRSVFGRQFATQVERGQIVQNPQDAVTLSRLSDPDLKAVGKLLQQGWGYDEAIEEVAGRLKPDDQIRDLHTKTVQAGGRLRTVVAGFHHVVVSETRANELDVLRDWPK